MSLYLESTILTDPKAGDPLKVPLLRESLIQKTAIRRDNDVVSTDVRGCVCRVKYNSAMKLFKTAVRVCSKGKNCGLLPVRGVDEWLFRVPCEFPVFSRDRCSDLILFPIR